MMRIRRRHLPGFVAFALTACGGGSDAPPPAAALADITPENAEVISAAVMKAIFEGGEIGSFVDLSDGLGGAGLQKPVGVFSTLGDVQIAQTKALLTESQIGTFQAPIAPVESACAAGGSVVTSGDIQDPEALSVDDIFSIEFIDCDDGFSVVDGTLSMTIRQFAGDFVGGSGSFEVEAELVALTVTESGQSQTADGDLTIAMSFASTGPLTMTISSQNLTFTAGVRTSTLTSFALSQTIDPVVGEYTLTASGRIAGSTFDGAVDFATDVAFAGNGDGLAYAGELVITGRADETITVVVLDSAFVRLAVDADGDGIAETAIDSSWDALI